MSLPRSGLAARSWFVGVLVVVCAVAAFPAHARSASDALNVLNQGVTLYHDGDYQAAEHKFLQAQALAPDRANPYRWLVLTQAKLGKCSAVRVNFEAFRGLVGDEDTRLSELVEAKRGCVERVAPQARPSTKLPSAPAPVAPGGPTIAAPASSKQGPTTVASAEPTRGDLVTPPPEEPPPKRSRKMLWVGLGVATAVVAASLAVGLGVGLTASHSPETTLGKVGIMP